MESILIVVLSATAALFATLFFTNRKAASKYEGKADQLSSEMIRLREELSGVRATAGTRKQPVKVDLIKEFLEQTQGLDCKVFGEGDLISFRLGDSTYHIDTRRLPQQVAIRKGYNMENQENVDWDAVRRAALDVMDGLVMIKMNVDPEEKSFDYYIVSPDRSMDNFQSNFEFYIGLIADAEKLFYDKYTEYKEEEQDVSARIDEMAAEVASKHQGSQKMMS